MFQEKVLVEEAYFGRTDDVLKIEGYISKLRQTFKKDGIKPSMNETKLMEYFTNIIEHDKDYINLCHSIEKAFGFSFVSVGFDSDKTANAYTIVYDVKVKNFRNVGIKVSNSGVRFAKKLDMKLSMFFTAGLVCNYNFSDREITAILLHEIGHNFSGFINDYVGFFRTTFDNLYLSNRFARSMIETNINLKTKMSGDEFRKLQPNDMAMYIANDFLSKNDINKFAKGFFISAFILTIIMGIGLAALALAAVLITLVTTIVTFIVAPITFISFLFKVGYVDEKVADNFAAMYGYGKDLSSGLYRMGHLHKEHSKIDSFVKALAMSPLFAFVDLVDEHPTEVERLSENITYLEEELDQTVMDKRTRESLERDIKEMKSMLRDHYNLKRTVNKMDNAGFVRESASIVLYDTIKHGDFNGVITDEVRGTNI